jgi:hypothetical protein
LFDQCISEADRLADVALQQSSDDVRALFVKTITNGLRADYIALIDGHGVRADREKRLQNLRSTALHGYYLEPFAKLLLAVAALRDNQKDKAREILSELHNRFPDNHLYSVELNRLSAPTQ